MNAMASIRKEFLELARTYRLLILAVVLILFGLLSPLLAKITPEMIRLVPGGESLSGLIPTPTAADAIGQFVKNIVQFGLLLALLLSMGAVAQEKERGTAILVLVKPLPRPIFILTKFAALALVFLACLIVAGLGGYLYTLILFGPTSVPGWAVMILLIWVYMLVVIALTVLTSTLTKSQAAAAGVAVGVLLVIAVVSAIPGTGQYLPGHLANWGAVQAGVPAPAGVPSLWPALIVSLAMIAVSLIAAVLIFDRQEI